MIRNVISLCATAAVLAGCTDLPRTPEEALQTGEQINLLTQSELTVQAILPLAIADDRVEIGASYPGHLDGFIWVAEPVVVTSNLTEVLEDIEARSEPTLDLFHTDFPFDPSEVGADLEASLAAVLTTRLPVSEFFRDRINALDCNIDLEIDARITTVNDIDFTAHQVTYDYDGETARIDIALDTVHLSVNSNTDIELEVPGIPFWDQWVYCYAIDAVDLDLDGNLDVDIETIDITLEIDFVSAGDACVDDCCTPRIDAEVIVADIDVRGVTIDAPSLEWDTIVGDFDIPFSDSLVESPELRDRIDDAIEDVSGTEIGVYAIAHGLAEARAVIPDSDRGFSFDWGDEDEDGIEECSDNCPDVTNPDQDDQDTDGLGDVCDDDVDGDGIDDVDDLCPDLFDDQSDLDLDGLGDACDDDRDGDGTDNTEDGCPDIFEFFQVDADGDGLNLSCDNCPSVANPSQRDLDFDGLGDACDPDMDGDGLEDVEDNCPETYNPDQHDFDHDGEGRACDRGEIEEEIRAWVEALREKLGEYLYELPPEREPVLPECLKCPTKPTDYYYATWKLALEAAEVFTTDIAKSGLGLTKDKYGTVTLEVDAMDGFLMDGMKLDEKGLTESYDAVGIDL